MAVVGEVAKLQPGYAFQSKAFASAGVRLLRGINIVPGGMRWNEVVHLAQDRAQDFEAYRLAPGDIVIAMDRPLISSGLKIARVAVGDLPALLLQRVGRFIVNSHIDAGYLYLFLSSASFIAHVGGQATGTQLPHISGTDIETAPIPLPPLAQQRRIVAKIEALTQKSRRAKEALDAIPPLLERFRQSVLASAFRGDLTEDWRAAHPTPSDDWWDVLRARLADASGGGGKRKRLWGSGATAEGVAAAWGELPASWRWVRVGELGREGQVVQIGPMSMKSSEFTEDGRRVLNVGCVQWGRIELSKSQYLPEARARQFERYELLAGDILVTRSGTVGRTALLSPELTGALMTFHLLRIRVAQEACLPEYLGYLLRGCSSTKQQLDASAIGATRAGLNTRLLEDLLIPLPPLSEQHVVVAQARKMDAAVTRAERLVGDCATACDRLDRSVLAKAFRGELTNGA